MEKIIDNWRQVLALMAGCGALLWVAVLATVHLLKKAKEAGVDDVEVGNVKVDFDDEK